MSKLDALRCITSVVADTGDIDAIRQHQPEDATTNPSLILKAAALTHYQPLLGQALSWAKQQDNHDTLLSNACDHLAVHIGCDILTIIPGRISTEVDARLSFDQQATEQKARKLIAMYEAEGVSRERILIKIAATWEGIQAARTLEAEGIHCNLTLLFSFAQAVACADANVTLISPFVGRILDWHKSNEPNGDYNGANDPGVQSVSQIYHYYKQHDIRTIVMGASFRNVSEIEQLAGCDKLTISPELLSALASDERALSAKLSPEISRAMPPQAKQSFTEAEFRWALNQDAMATDKLADGIRRFAMDQVALETLLASLE